MNGFSKILLAGKRPQEAGDPLPLVGRIIEYLDPSPAPLLLYRDLRLEDVAQFIFELDMRGVLRAFLPRGRGPPGRREPFGLPYGEVFGYYLSAQSGLRAMALHREYGPGVAHGNRPLYQLLFHLVGEFQEPQVVRHSRSVLANLFGDLLLREPEVNEATEGLGLLHGVKVLPLYVLYDGELEALLVGNVLYDHGDVGKTGGPGSPPPPLPGDKLITSSEVPPHDKGLYHPLLLNGVRELSETLLVEALPWLKPVRGDFIYGTFKVPPGITGFFNPAIHVPYEGAQAPAQNLFLHNRLLFAYNLLI